MTTAAQLIDRATGLIGVRAIGQTLSGEVSADCLNYLRMMLDGWRLELGLTGTTKLSVPVVAGKDSYQISPSGDVVSITPIQVLSAYTDIGGTKYDAQIVAENRWDSLDDCTGNIPNYAFFDGLNLKISPTPTESATMVVTVKAPLPEFPAVTSDVALSAGIESAIVSNLAVLLCPVFEKQPGQLLMMTASNSKRALKQANFAPAAVDCPIGIGRSFDIVRGY